MDYKSAESAARHNPLSTGRFSEAVERHSEEIHELRWILLNMLWHSFPVEASDNWIKKQIMKAGATEAEVAKLSG
jgi:hypothetical protein